MEAEFDALLKAVEQAHPPRMSNVVVRHVVMDYFDKAIPINWADSSTNEEFQVAIQYNVISQDPPHDVLWTGTRMRKLRSALNDLVRFLDDNGRKLAEHLGEDIPMDPTDLEFWDHHMR